MNSKLENDTENFIRMASDFNYRQAVIEGIKATDLDSNPEVIGVMQDALNEETVIISVKEAILHKLLNASKKGNESCKKVIVTEFLNENFDLDLSQIELEYRSLNAEDKAAFLSCFSEEDRRDIKFDVDKKRFLRKALNEFGFYETVDEVRKTNFNEHPEKAAVFMSVMDNGYVDHQIKQVILEEISVAGYEGNSECKMAIRDHFKTKSGGVNYKEVDDDYYLLYKSKTPKPRKAFLTCVMG